MKEPSNYLKHSNQIHLSHCSALQAMGYLVKYKSKSTKIVLCASIKSSDLEQLMTLLSKHTINLNSFNLSKDGDTILHSAAKSNNVKMIKFLLQKISPSTKQRMLKMKNKQEQLPSDLITVWAPSTHSLFPLKFRQVVKAVLMLGAKRQDGTPYYPQTHFYKLPKDLLFIILQYAIFSETRKPKIKETATLKPAEQHKSTVDKKRKRKD
jgi:hypothetical protein